DGTQAVMISSGPFDDYIEPVARETGAIYVDDIVDFREFMALASRAAYIISGRYHNVILAAIMGTPSIPLGSTTHKVHGACELLEGVMGTPYDGTFLRPDLDAMARQTHDYREHRTEWASRLREISRRRRDEVLGLGTFVND